MRVRTPALLLAMTTLAASAFPVLASDTAEGQADPATRVYDAHAAFDRLKAMEGTWTGQVTEASGSSRDTTIVWEVSAAGHSVIQTFAPGQPYEMFSVYHMDGDELLMTHYCAIGNAPKMKFEPTGTPGEIAFAFNGGTNFDPNVDAHAHEGKTQVIGPDEVRTQSVGYSEGKPTPPRTFHMKRQ